MAMSKKAYERSREDREADRKTAARKGVSVTSYEDSPSDRRADRKLMAKMEAKRGKKR